MKPFKALHFYLTGVMVIIAGILSAGKPYILTGLDHSTGNIRITQSPSLVPGTAGSDQTICYNTVPEGLSATIPTGGMTPYSYQWQSSGNGTVYSDIPGATTLTYQPGTLTATTRYRQVQTSSGGLGSVTTNIVTITVSSTFSAGTVGSDQTICANTTPAPLTGTPPAGGTTPYTYQWKSSLNGTTFSAIPGATSLTHQPGPLTVNTWYRMFQQASSCGSGLTNLIKITVLPQMIPGTATASQTICYNTAPAALNATAPTGGMPPYNYQWQSSGNGTVYSDIPGATTLTYQPGALTATTLYRQIQTSPGGFGPVSTNIVTITVSPNFTTGLVGSDQTICANTAPALLTGIPPTGGTPPYTYQWKSSVNGTTFSAIPGATSLTHQPGPLTVNTWYRMFQQASSCGSGLTNIIKITVQSQLIPGTATASQTICFNTAPAALSATAPAGGPGPYNYQWQSSGNATVYSDIPGATILTYQPGMLTATTNYRQVQNSSGGCGSVNTNPVTITVTPPFVPGSAASDQTICYNTAPALLTGTPPSGGTPPYTCQWKSSTNGTTFIPIVGATGLTYQPGPLTVDTWYRMFQQASSCGSGLTNIIKITVLPQMIAGTATASQTVCYNTTPAVLNATGPTGGITPYSYQWQSSGNGTVYSDIPGATSLTYQPGTLTATTRFRQVQTSQGGCGSVNTNVVVITVSPTFITGSAASDQTICYNTAPALLTSVPPTGGTPPYTYQWKISTNGTTFTPIAGATGLTYQPGPLTVDTWYRMYQQASSCGSGLTNIIKISVLPQMIAGTATASQTVCYNTTPAALNATAPTGGITPYSYQWQSSGNGTVYSDIPGATALTYQSGPLTATTHYRQVQNSSGGCGSVNTNAVAITVTPPFVPGSAASDQTICYNTAPALLTCTPSTGGTPPYTYQWKSSTNGTTFTPIAGATGLTFQPGTLTTTTWYRIYQQASSCGSGLTNIIKITVLPPFNVGSAGSDQSICYNTAPVKLTGVAPTGGNPPYSYQWKSSTNGTTFTPIPGATGLDYQPEALTVNTWYRIFQLASGCGSGLTNIIKITINPLPAPIVVSVTDPANKVCPNTGGHVYSTDPGMPAYNWNVTGPPGTMIFTGQTTSAITVFWGSPGTTGGAVTGTVQVTVTDQNGCLGTSQITPVTIAAPLAAGIISAAQTIEYYTIPAPLTSTPPTGGYTPYSYQWQRSTDGINFSDIAGAVNPGYAPGILTVSTWYRLIQASSLNCGSATGNILKITVNPPYINILSPNGGENWDQGSVHNITWTDNIPDSVMIELYKGGAFLQLLAGSLPSTGSYTWNIPADQPAGNDYKVKIKSMRDNAIYDFSNDFFTILYVLPQNRTVQNVVVAAGQLVCYDALQTIYVAGSGTTFTVQSGGSATFVAGLNILFLPGTTVDPGGYLHGSVTTIGQYCGIQPASMVSAITGIENPALKMPASSFILYPNPTQGVFTLALKDRQEPVTIYMEICDQQGRKIISKDLSGAPSYLLSMPQAPSGLYFVRLVCEGKVETFKLLKATP